jgi:hypothetical protein
MGQRDKIGGGTNNKQSKSSQLRVEIYSPEFNLRVVLEYIRTPKRKKCIRQEQHQGGICLTRAITNSMPAPPLFLDYLLRSEPESFKKMEISFGKLFHYDKKYPTPAKLLCELHPDRAPITVEQIASPYSGLYQIFSAIVCLCFQLSKTAHEVVNCVRANVPIVDYLTVTWWTHALKGLHRNDFVMAAKSDAVYQSSQAASKAAQTA